MNPKKNFDESIKRAALARAGKKTESGKAGRDNDGKLKIRDGKGLIITLLSCAILFAAASLWLLLGAEGEVFTEKPQTAEEEISELLENVTEGTSADSPGTVAEEPSSEFPEAAAEAADYGLEIHFLDVGQGACVLIKADGHAMLVDGGPDKKGTWVQRYLNRQGIEKLDYVIGTHYDADHVGGLDVALYKFECGTVLLPQYEKDTKSCRDVLEVLKNKQISPVHPQVGDCYRLGKGEFTIVAPGADFFEDENDYSIGLIYRYGDISILLTGDATGVSEKMMLDTGIDLKADVYFVGHHGSSSSSTTEFLAAVNPSVAVISCGKDNDYGHPHKSTLKRLQNAGAEVFRTDTQGTIILKSDGKTMIWETGVVSEK